MELKKRFIPILQYKKTTDLFSLNTDRVFKKIGVNEKNIFQNGVLVYFVLIDSKPHLTFDGVDYLSKKTKGIFIITTNVNHPAFELSKHKDNIKVFTIKTRLIFLMSSIV